MQTNSQKLNQLDKLDNILVKLDRLDRLDKLDKLDALFAKLNSNTHLHYSFPVPFFFSDPGYLSSLYVDIGPGSFSGGGGGAAAPAGGRTRKRTRRNSIVCVGTYSAALV